MTSAKPHLKPSLAAAATLRRHASAPRPVHFRYTPLTLLLPFIAGCGLSVSPAATNPIPASPRPIAGVYPGPPFTGAVFAGSSPIASATIELYAAGATGNGIAAGPLLAATLTTSADGAFAVTEPYACPLPTTQIYLVARAGSHLGPAAPPNPAIALLSAIGPCNQLPSGSHVIVDEVTTVVAVWSLAQFLSPEGAIGASGTNATGLANAFSTASSLLPAPLPDGGTLLPGTSPQSRIHSLANLLNTCTAAAHPQGSCAALFAAASSPMTAPPQDTLAAALSIARNPARNVSVLAALSRASHAFAPALRDSPQDWTLSRTFSGGGLAGPTTLGIASTGNVWVANYFGVASAFSPTGVPLFPSGVRGHGLDHSYGLTIDATDNIWIANQDAGTLTELSGNGLALSGDTGYTAANLSYPVGIAAAPTGGVWVANIGDGRVSRVSPSGTAVGYPVGAFPSAVAVDALGDAWVTAGGGTTVTRVHQDGTRDASAACCQAPSAIAIDPRGFGWVANFLADSVTQISSRMNVVAPAYVAPSLLRPQGVAVDGTGNVWVASYRAPGVTELAGSQNPTPGAVLSPPAGWAAEAPLVEAYSIAIDASGNLWISSFGNSTVTEIVGLAAPVKTPRIGPAESP